MGGIELFRCHLFGHGQEPIAMSGTNGLFLVRLGELLKPELVDCLQHGEPRLSVGLAAAADYQAVVDQAPEEVQDDCCRELGVDADRLRGRQRAPAGEGR